jgi:hypothetical protein
MPWNLRSDGSVESESGSVVFFSAERFERDIGLGDCCFICGANPRKKLFNNEHILPEWVLRRFNLFGRTIKLPNGRSFRYDQYTIPCCTDCNSMMGHIEETPISAVVSAGTDAVQDFVVQNGSLKFFVWLGLISLKTHLKDKYLRFNLDRRLPDEKIADSYNWGHLHHLHCISRCFYNNAVIQKEAFGSMLVLAIKTHPDEDNFDFADLYAAQTMMLRLGNVGFVVVFNDSCGATNGFMPTLERINQPISTVQLRDIMTDMAFMNLSIKERPQFMSQFDRNKEEISLAAKLPRQFELVENLDYRLRGRLLRQALEDILPRLKSRDMSDDELQVALTEGRLTFLFDKEGNLMEHSFEPA